MKAVWQYTVEGGLNLINTLKMKELANFHCLPLVCSSKPPFQKHKNLSSNHFWCKAVFAEQIVCQYKAKIAVKLMYSQDF